MDTKKYPKKSMVPISTSTNVVCAGCNGPTGIYEDIFQVEGSNVFYHKGCVSDSDTDKATETKIVNLQLTDDLNVKSEGA